MEKKPLLLLAALGSILLLAVLGYYGIQRPTQTESTPAAQATPAPLALQPCDEEPQPLCILSAGLDANQNLLLTLQSNQNPAPEIFLITRQNNRPIRFGCRAVELAPDTLYCLGTAYPGITSLQVQAYSHPQGILLAEGSLSIQNGAVSVQEAPLQTPQVRILALPTSAAYPAAYPAYP